MFELLKILFLGKMILLTPTYIDINHNHPFYYEKELSIINKEATLQIDLTLSKVKDILDLTGISEQASDEKLDSFLKMCPMEVYGVNKEVKLFFNPPYISMGSNRDIRLEFSLSDPTNIHNINELHIESSCLLDNVKVYWKNYNE